MYELSIVHNFIRLIYDFSEQVKRLNKWYLLHSRVVLKEKLFTRAQNEKLFVRCQNDECCCLVFAHAIKHGISYGVGSSLRSGGNPTPYDDNILLIYINM